MEISGTEATAGWRLFSFNDDASAACGTSSRYHNNPYDKMPSLHNKAHVHMYICTCAAASHHEWSQDFCWGIEGERVRRPISLNMSLRRPFHEGLKLKQEKWAVTRNASGPSWEARPTKRAMVDRSSHCLLIDTGPSAFRMRPYYEIPWQIEGSRLQKKGHTIQDGLLTFGLFGRE